jgi:hypothetical protein
MPNLRTKFLTVPVSLSDPDARSMATSGKGTATVGYNVQIAVDAEYHLIVAHEVINQGYDRHQLAPMAFKAQQATGCEQITALADRGYFNGDQVLSCEGTGAAPIVPKTLTSSGAKRGFFTRQTSSTTPSTIITPARRAQNSPKSIAAWITRKTSTATAT